MKSIYIYGASGHGLVVADVARACGYDDIIFLDDGNNNYLTFESIKVNHENIPLAFGIGSNQIREKLFRKVCNHGIEIVTLVHPSAIISSSSTIDVGTVIMPMVVVNAFSKIKKGVILNTGSIIEHENVIKSFSHISPNCSFSGNVIVGTKSHIGVGTSIIQGVKVGKNCVVGAGSVIVRNIGNNKLAYGNPCRVKKVLSE